MSETVPKRQHVVEAGEAFDALLHRVVALNRAFGAAGEMLTRPTGQSFARYSVLREARQGDASVAEIARRLRVKRQGVQRLADALAADGLVAYADNPRHQRAKLVRPTDAGRTVLDEVAAAQRAWTQQLGRRIGRSKLQQADEILAVILAAVEAG
jgi:DNA-binding MarR family transcriptional regulator